jgi:hypothetical protein
LIILLSAAVLVALAPTQAAVALAVLIPDHHFQSVHHLQ